jgi:hypothetical protein
VLSVNVDGDGDEDGDVVDGGPGTTVGTGTMTKEVRRSVYFVVQSSNSSKTSKSSSLVVQQQYDSCRRARLLAIPDPSYLVPRWVATVQ